MQKETRIYNKICSYCNEPYKTKRSTSKCCKDSCNKKFYKLKKQREKDAQYDEIDLPKKTALQTNILLGEILNEIKLTNRQLAISGKPYLTPTEVCAMLSFSRRTFKRLAQKTQLHIYRFGKNQQYIKREDLDKLFLTPQTK